MHNATTYNILIEKGHLFEDFVCLAMNDYLDIVIQNIKSRNLQRRFGDSFQGYEIKLDERCTDTNQLSIEIAERSISNKWVKSGIYSKDDAKYYIQGNYNRFYVFEKNDLIHYHQNNNVYDMKQKTIYTFFIPLNKAFELAKHVLSFKKLDY